MSAKFEIVQDDHGRFCFRLIDADETMLLTGLPNSGKIAVQGDVQRTRQSIRAADRFHPHTAHDGSLFAVLKDKNGSVLARSRVVAQQPELDGLLQRIGAIAGDAPLLDHARA